MVASATASIGACAGKAQRVTYERAVRSALLELHRELLEAQRWQAERFGGRMSAGELLQAAAADLRFDWLGTISQLSTDFDAAIAADADPELLASAVAHTRELLAPPDPASAFGARYLQALQDHPEVVMAHRDVVAAL